MAVDAKDQVTHGHIRRVQRFAVELAKELGVSDDQQLKAIEAAALLHDMGKLAIPEFILNKPGKLTASEFEVMKTTQLSALTSSRRFSSRTLLCLSSGIITRTGMARVIRMVSRVQRSPLALEFSPSLTASTH